MRDPLATELSLLDDAALANRLWQSSETTRFAAAEAMRRLRGRSETIDETLAILRRGGKDMTPTHRQVSALCWWLAELDIRASRAEVMAEDQRTRADFAAPPAAAEDAR